MKVSWGSWIGLAGLIAIVFVVVWPMYGDYTNRSQAAEAVSLLSEAKFPLSEYFANHDKWPKSLEEVKSSTKGKYTQSVVISKGAGSKGELELTATMKSEGVDRRVTGQSVRLATKDGGRNWVCSPGTMDVKNLPGACRPSN